MRDQTQGKRDYFPSLGPRLLAFFAFSPRRASTMAMRFSRRITAKSPAGAIPNKEVDIKKAELLVLVTGICVELAKELLKTHDDFNGAMKVC